MDILGILVVSILMNGCSTGTPNEKFTKETQAEAVEAAKKEAKLNQRKRWKLRK